MSLSDKKRREDISLGMKAFRQKVKHPFSISTQFQTKGILNAIRKSLEKSEDFCLLFSDLFAVFEFLSISVLLFFLMSLC